MLESSPGSKILALIHTHENKHGFINGGDQEYWVSSGIVRQRNVKSKSTYYHPNITPFWLTEKKVYWDDHATNGVVKGIKWDAHFVCDDTWIIEIVQCFRDEKRELCDEEIWERDFLASFSSEETPVVAEARVQPLTVLPTPDGKFVELVVANDELFNVLRRQAAGKKRDGKEGTKLFEELLASAKHLAAPGSLFPDKEPMHCPDHLIMDHVVSAFMTDVSREINVMESVSTLRPVLATHARSLVSGGGRLPSFKKMTTADLFALARRSVKVGIAVNDAIRSKGAVGSALRSLDEAIN
jgi:hypothetical protein